jgi:hypothetical protein
MRVTDNGDVVVEDESVTDRLSVDRQCD